MTNESTRHQRAQFAGLILMRMAEQGISRAELAKRAKVSPAFLSRVLMGEANMELKTMTRIARALGCWIRIYIAPKDSIDALAVDVKHESSKKEEIRGKV